MATTIMRYDVIQWAINQLQKKRQVNYLEIGVQRGFCFFKIKADKKIAVDPHFIIDDRDKAIAYKTNPTNRQNIFFEKTSDRFFTEETVFLSEIDGLDVVLIDGLHLYEQVVRDVDNVLQYLKPDGYIILHDCNPTFKAGAIRGYSPAEVAATNPEGWNGTWHGDVWKAIVRLRAERDDLNISVYDCDFGLGIIRWGQPDGKLEIDVQTIDTFGYDDLEANRHFFLNLQSQQELEFLFCNR